MKNIRNPGIAGQTSEVVTPNGDVISGGASSTDSEAVEGFGEQHKDLSAENNVVEAGRPRIAVTKPTEPLRQSAPNTLREEISDAAMDARKETAIDLQTGSESGSSPNEPSEPENDAGSRNYSSEAQPIDHSPKDVTIDGQAERPDSTDGIRRKLRGWFGSSRQAEPDPQTPRHLDAEHKQNPDPHPQIEPISSPSEGTSGIDNPHEFSMPRLRFGESAWDANEPWWSHKDWTKLPLSGPPDDLIVRNGTYGRFAAIGGSVRGTMHRPRAELNDDAFTIHGVEHPDFEEPMYLVAVIADGVGSSEYSSFSSRIYVEAAARWISHELKAFGSGALDQLAARLNEPESQFLIDVAEQVRGSYKLPMPDWVRQHPNIPPANTDDNEIQCTLTFAVVDLQTDDHGNVLIGAIGDSPAMQIVDGDLVVLHPKVSENDEIYSTATQVAIGATSLELMKATVQPGSPLILMTDGVGNFLKFRGTTPLGKFIATAWCTPVDHFQFIRDLSFNIRGADDDRTALVLWAREPA